MESTLQEEQGITIEDKIQDQKKVKDYNYLPYNDRFLSLLPKMKCPTCHSKELAYHFCSDKTIIACQNMKKKTNERGETINVCNSIGNYVFLTYHLLDDRFGQIISKLVPFRYRKISDLSVLNQRQQKEKVAN